MANSCSAVRLSTFVHFVAQPWIIRESRPIICRIRKFICLFIFGLTSLARHLQEEVNYSMRAPQRRILCAASAAARFLFGDISSAFQL